MTEAFIYLQTSISITAECDLNGRIILYKETKCYSTVYQEIKIEKYCTMQLILDNILIHHDFS